MFEAEPPPKDHPLLRMPNVIVTPHTASTAFENSRKGVAHWLDNIVRVSKGEAIPDKDRVGLIAAAGPRHPAQPRPAAAWPRMAR